jgi:hypothetical protein
MPQLEGCHDTQHNDTEHNDTSYNGLICDTQHTTFRINDTQLRSIKCHYAESSVILLVGCVSLGLVSLG